VSFLEVYKLEFNDCVIGILIIIEINPINPNSNHPLTILKYALGASMSVFQRFEFQGDTLHFATSTHPPDAAK
jgi:hypothetical protein